MSKIVVKKKIISKKEKNKTEFSQDYRDKVLDSMLKHIEKKVKGSTWWKLKDPNLPTLMRRVIPTNLPSLDIILARTKKGRSGFPISRMVEICGQQQAGKTSLCCHLVAAAQQRLGWNAFWLEHENKFDPDWAQTLGVDPDHMVMLYPKTLEETILEIEKILEKMPKKSELPEGMKMFGTIIIVDSVAAMPTEDELKKGIEKNNIGTFQKKMSQALKIINRKVSNRNVTIVWVNQLRNKIQLNRYQSTQENTGEMFTSFGGMALKYYPSLRLQLYTSRPKDPKLKDRGVMINVITSKNQCGFRPFRKVPIFMNYDIGFDYFESWKTAMECLHMVTRKGNKSLKFNVGPQEGMEISFNKLSNMFQENPEFFYEYEKLIDSEQLKYYEQIDKIAKKNEKASTESD